MEIGWRLSHDQWGKGYATEAAKAALSYGFETLHLPEIVAFALPNNLPSIHVMEKIGMTRDLEGDFIHPHFPSCHMVLYRISSTGSPLPNNAL